MSILLTIIVVLVILSLALYAVRSSPIANPFNWVIQVLMILVAILVIAHRAGLSI